MILCLVGVREGLPEKQMRKLKLYLEILTLNLRNECVCVCVCVCARVRTGRDRMVKNKCTRR